MKKFLMLTLAAAMVMSLFACAAKKDISGKYELHKDRNEAIINDGGVVSVANDGNNRVFYHIFVGSFSDSNGDGCGDLRGIINRFDYLNDGDPNSGVSLGIEGIWLSPIFTSPSYHKYDVTDYYEIDPQFGTMEDLKELIELCHQRGVKLILDLVINHTATNNKWFQEFTKAHKSGNFGNEYYNFYTYAEAPIAGRTFIKIAGSDHYYEGNFSDQMPELNFDNPDVRKAMVDVAKFYLDMGIDGFRFDAAKYIYYGETTTNTDFWDWYMAELRKIKPDVYSVAEVWDSDGITIPYFSSTNCFNFNMAQSNGLIVQAAQGGDVNSFTAYVENYINSIKALRQEANLVTFIANHDTDRAAGFLPVSNGRAFVGANISLLMPGSTFVYYGEEIGMRGSRGGANTDANRRLAMLWGDDDTVKDPVGADYTGGQTNGTVKDQLPDGGSLYSHYKKLIQIRKANPEIVYGTYKALQLENTKLGGFVSTYNGSSVVVLHNTTTEEVSIDLSQISGVSLTTLAAFAGVNGATLEGTTLTIGAQTSVVLR